MGHDLRLDLHGAHSLSLGRDDSCGNQRHSGLQDGLRLLPVELNVRSVGRVELARRIAAALPASACRGFDTALIVVDELGGGGNGLGRYRDHVLSSPCGWW